MANGWRSVGGCLALPVVLIGGCTGKMYVDQWMYNLPGPVLASAATPTQVPATAMQVAEALDTYVQPRFEILRDKTFGAFRIVYRRHAGLAQLKVESAREKELIANVNATKRDYAISLLHCVAGPNYSNEGKPRLQLLYFNQQRVISDSIYSSRATAERATANTGLELAAIEKRAATALPRLLAGKEHRLSQPGWDVLMRPVQASKRECLGCHKGSRLGDTLGVMVYAVRATPRLALAQRASR